jgi:autotransporter-associated beta strand protein
MGSGFENQGALELLNHNVIWSGDIILVDVAQITTTGSSILTVQGSISGDSLMTAGTGDVQLSGVNTYIGATFVLGGNLDVYNSQSFGSSNAEGVTVCGGAALRLFAGISNPKPLTLLGNSKLVGETNCYWFGPTTFDGSAQVVVNPNTRMYLTGFLSGTNDARLELEGGGNLILALIIGTDQFATVLGPNPLDINQIQIYSGTLSLNSRFLKATVAERLTVSLAEGFTPTLGQQFTLVHNLTTNPVQGTFSGLSEGATFTVDGFTFQITYKGGAGNDVVLTRIA